MADVIKSPRVFTGATGPSVFLAGSIDMGRAVDWQAALADQLVDVEVTLLNPRRDDWNPAWEPSIEQPEFRGQVEWELDGLAAADIIVMYLAADSMAPVSLLELGLFARSERLVVVCEAGFWRKGNVDIVCARFDIPQLESLDDLADHIRATVT